MASCEKLNTCPFFNNQLSTMPSVSGLLKDSYCLSDKDNCARYIVSSAKLPVPPDLFPNDSARAKEIVARRRS